MLKLKTCLNYKRISVNLYKDIVLVIHVHIFCTALFTNNNIKEVLPQRSHKAVYLKIILSLIIVSLKI